MAMTDEQIERYSRHIILKEVGAKGQKKLLKGKVLTKILDLYSLFTGCICVVWFI